MKSQYFMHSVFDDHNAVNNTGIENFPTNWEWMTWPNLNLEFSILFFLYRINLIVDLQCLGINFSTSYHHISYFKNPQWNGIYTCWYGVYSYTYLYMYLFGLSRTCYNRIHIFPLIVIYTCSVKMMNVWKF